MFKDDLLRNANAVEITADILIAANELHASLPPADRADLGIFTFRLLDMLHERDLKGDMADTALAISWRLEALVRLEVSGRSEIKGWTLPSDEDGAILSSQELFEVAASQPIIEFDDRPAFDADAFFSELLAHTNTQGSS